MLPKKRHPFLSYAPCLLALALVASGAVQAQVAKQGFDTLSNLAFQSDLLDPSQPLEALDNVQGLMANTAFNNWNSFRLNAPTEWRATVDQRSGMIAFAEGGNIAWIPGRGNSLTANDLAPVLRLGKVDLTAMEKIARSYLAKNGGMLGVDTSSLVLNLGRSGQPASHLWFRRFRRRARGARGRERPGPLPGQQWQPDPVRLRVPALSGRRRPTDQAHP